MIQFYVKMASENFEISKKIWQFLFDRKFLILIFTFQFLVSNEILESHFKTWLLRQIRHALCVIQYNTAVHGTCCTLNRGKNKSFINQNLASLFWYKKTRQTGEGKLKKKIKTNQNKFLEYRPRPPFTP